MSTSPFVRNADYRSTVMCCQPVAVGTLKLPKLPGTERFRFTRSSEDLHCNSSKITSGINISSSHLLTPSATQSFYPADPRWPRNDSPRYGNLTTSGLCRTNASARQSSTCHRRPIIPISKQTSRVLNNTNAALSAETIDLICNDTSNLNNMFTSNGFVVASKVPFPSTSISKSSSTSSNGTNDRRHHQPVPLNVSQPPNNNVWISELDFLV